MGGDAPSPHAPPSSLLETEPRAVAEGVLGASDQVARGERLRDSRAAGDGALRMAGSMSIP